MHARQLIELASLVSAHAPIVLESCGGLSTASVDQYWSRSRSRLDRWGRAMKEYRASAENAASDQQTSDLWRQLRPVLEEIFTGEMLVRVWGGVLAAHDEIHHSRDLEPIARSVQVGQGEASNRALTLLIHGPQIRLEDAAGMNRLRHRVERWTDLLLSHLVVKYGVSQFAFQPERSYEFAGDLTGAAAQHRFGRVWPLVLASLAAAFRDELCEPSPNPDLNQAIANSVLAGFPAGVFDSTGNLHSLRVTRLLRGVPDSQGMLEELLAVEPSPRTPPHTLPSASGPRFTV